MMIFSFGCKKAADDSLASLSPPDWTITGSWKTRSSCIYMGPNVYVSAIYQYQDNGRFLQTTEVYTDSKCTKYSYKKEVAGTYLTNSSSKSGGSVSGYINIDSTLSSYDMTPPSTSAAALLNVANFCGYNNWANGVKKSVIGRTCSSVAIPLLGSIEYSLLQKYFQDFSVIYPPDMPLKPPDEYYYRDDLMPGTTSTGYDGKTQGGRHDTILSNFAMIRQ